MSDGGGRSWTCRMMHGTWRRNQSFNAILMKIRIASARFGNSG
jgi:hypothetical protein